MADGLEHIRAIRCCCHRLSPDRPGSIVDIMDGVSMLGKGAEFRDSV